MKSESGSRSRPFTGRARVEGLDRTNAERVVELAALREESQALAIPLGARVARARRICTAADLGAGERGQGSASAHPALVARRCSGDNDGGRGTPWTAGPRPAGTHTHARSEKERGRAGGLATRMQGQAAGRFTSSPLADNGGAHGADDVAECLFVPHVVGRLAAGLDTGEHGQGSAERERKLEQACELEFQRREQDLADVAAQPTCPVRADPNSSCRSMDTRTQARDERKSPGQR